MEIKQTDIYGYTFWPSSAIVIVNYWRYGYHEIVSVADKIGNDNDAANCWFLSKQLICSFATK